jgi:hypothetical protein
MALQRRDTRSALASLRAATPLADASGVRALQLHIALMEAVAMRRDVGRFDAPTAQLGNAGLRIEWLEAALSEALARGDGAAAARHYREAADLLGDTHSAAAIRLHELGARAHELAGDGRGAQDATAAAKDARDARARTLPARRAADTPGTPTPQGAR